ncbi:DUF4112 domain-containing protein [Fulvivirga ulvae]|uniref:DUF4112 domain-containing protein n=1 Tax=Fulvivirga ulvae TaxID=2904245 RepID=UPI001F38CAC6|nr:DUF4112 domain-containing protein [Fulvivirga ulvae]UII31175.1 DUF4112 domain-containing protein [Fulvivirga ulvae]
MKTITIEPEVIQTKLNKPNLQRVERISRLMDSKFTIPGTKIRFGLDPVLSLVPVLGDIATFIISGVLIHTMYNHGASGKLVTKMVINATLDAIIGAIPVAGSVFDIFFRANDRNVRLLKEYYEEDKHTGSGKGLLLTSVIVLFAITIAILFVIGKLLEALFEILF